MTRPITEVLSVERVREAYKATGLKPVRECWFEPDDLGGCACAAGVVLHASGFDTDQPMASAKDPFIPFAASLGVRPTELLCFVDGFDGNAFLHGWDDTCQDIDQGHRDAYWHGRAVALVVFGDPEAPK